MEIDPSHNDALKNVCKVKEILKECSEWPCDASLHNLIIDAFELIDKTEEILAKG